MAGDLVRRQVAVIVASGIPSISAAKAATSTIPIAFILAEDPVRLGLVSSLARPGGNLTGVNFLSAELVAKRLELLRELVPRIARVAVLLNPADSARTESSLRDVEAAARAIGLQIQILNANTSREIDAAFDSIARDRPDALFVTTTTFLSARMVQLALLAAFYRLPSSHDLREFVEAGGLMSYGTNIADVYRQNGVYTGRLLKGAKPADLPVMQSSKFELVINAHTARMLGIEVPPMLLARADEVIE
jgi:putative tryptophan/tyrosine transport system substrate-binding protein